MCLAHHELEGILLIIIVVSAAAIMQDVGFDGWN